MKITILGSGSWGCALGTCWARRGHDVLLWARDIDVSRTIASEHRHPRRLQGTLFPDALRATSRLDEALAHSDTAVIAVPSAYLRAVLDSCPEPRSPIRFVSAVKGMDVDTRERASEIIRKRFGQAPVAVLSGPTFAEEVARGEPTAAVLADTGDGLSQELQPRLSTPEFRLYRSDDLVGVELAGSFKNVIAIGAGILTGLGFGHNTLAGLVTRGLAEMGRLLIARGGKERTLFGLAGIGDLMLTCTGKLSRNRRVGEEIGRGGKLGEILESSHEVAEGVRTCRVVPQMARESGVETPIADAVDAILYAGLDPRRAIAELMRRELKAE